MALGTFLRRLRIMIRQDVSIRFLIRLLLSLEYCASPLSSVEMGDHKSRSDALHLFRTKHGLLCPGESNSFVINDGRVGRTPAVESVASTACRSSQKSCPPQENSGNPLNRRESQDGQGSSSIAIPAPDLSNYDMISGPTPLSGQVLNACFLGLI